MAVLNDPSLYANMKTIIVTGATSGIGQVLAESLHHEGKKVIICGRRQTRLDEIVKNHKGIIAYHLDVANRDSCENFTKTVIKEHPDVDTLINNAGIQKTLNFEKGGLSEADWDEEIAINIQGVIRLTNLFLPHFQKKDHAAIVNVSSGLAISPFAAYPVYCASKAFLHSFSRSLRHQLRNTPVRVVEIIPPVVESDLNPQWRALPEVKERVAKVAMSGKDFNDAALEQLKKGELEFGVGFVGHMLAGSREAEFQTFNTMNPI